MDPVSFIEQLCENKDKPELNCDGKCYLSQVLKKSSETEQESSIPPSEWEDTVLFPAAFFKWKAVKNPIHSERILSMNSYYDYQESESLFHPPRI